MVSENTLVIMSPPHYKDPVMALTMGAARAAKAIPMPLPVRRLPPPLHRLLPIVVVFFLLVDDRLIFPAPNVLRPFPLG